MSCPDGGTCHHECHECAPCWRVQNAAPLSQYAERWPDEVLEANGMPPRPRTIPYALTEMERAHIREALQTYRMDTERAVQSTAPNTALHDPCCPTDAARRQVIAEMHARLQERLEHITSALAKLRP
jgi:hypothetical protein